MEYINWEKDGKKCESKRELDREKERGGGKEEITEMRKRGKALSESIQREVSVNH